MFRIKQAATLSGFSVDTLRFYDKQELASPSMRSASGYRLYNEDDIDRLRFIRHAKDIGFNLDSVRELLAIRLHKDQSSCEDVKSLTAEKLSEIDDKIRELQQMRAAVKRLHDNCCGGAESAEQCTILQALDSVRGV
ncbi:Zn(2+)-responsive transcriptional regulator [Pleionea litopenaei]|uniref:Zn(2+)-responsive transcriptional regulator n=1 Tax=Pleionea litopenaei TaxID=3070815 RepID=A0AA51RRQ0_9GAMM|nr:Zn(2+)-responsive transcriptional regulator [Pleionea sp. HL-JVS1]WMS86279.1 Zn(2+)-responsive transcriptional regulator [Pleionea sp. HL-JVS1]